MPSRSLRTIAPDSAGVATDPGNSQAPAKAAHVWYNNYTGSANCVLCWAPGGIREKESVSIRTDAVYAGSGIATAPTITNSVVIILQVALGRFRRACGRSF